MLLSTVSSVRRFSPPRPECKSARLWTLGEGDAITLRVRQRVAAVVVIADRSEASAFFFTVHHGYCCGATPQAA